MELVIFWIILSLAVGIAAHSRGRSFIGWALMALVVSPLISIFLLLVFPNLRRDPNAPTPETHVKCPDCRELVRADARKCRYCGCVLVPQVQAPTHAS